MSVQDNTIAEFLAALAPNSTLPRDDEGNVGPITDEGSCFVFGVKHGATADYFKECDLQPTAALYRDGMMILVWAFDAPVDHGEPRLKELAAGLGMDAIDEHVPVPGARRWKRAHLCKEARYPFDKVFEVYAAPEATEEGSEPTEGPEGEAEVASEASVDTAEPGDQMAPKTYADATMVTPYNETDYGNEVVITIGSNRQSKQWSPKSMPAGMFIASLCRHKEGQKDGTAFVLGDMVPGQRLKTSVKALWGVGLDIDTGTPTITIDNALKKLGCLAVRYSTHSSGKTKTEIKKDKVMKFAGDRDIDTELTRYFLREVEQWDSSIVDNAEYLGTEHTEKGIVCQITHPAMPKHRLVFLFKEPFDISKEASSQSDAMKLWAKVPEALARLLNVPFDTSCTDPSRLFYLPRHAKGKPFGISLFGGPYFDWRTLELEDPMEKRKAALNKGKSKSVTDEGRDLGHWHRKYGHGFQIADVMDAYAPTHIRHNTGHGLEIECPFDEDHHDSGNPEDRACLVVNAGEGPSEFFTIKCQHESCRDKTMLDMLGRMIAEGWFDKSVIYDEQFNAIIDEEDKPEAADGVESADDEKESFNFYDEAELIAGIDSICRVIALGGKRRFAFLGRDHEPQFLTQSDAAIELAQYKFWKNKGTDKKPDWVSNPAFNVWLGSSERKPNFSAARFEPNLKTGDVGNGLLNLWTGFAVTPAPGDWSLLRNHIWENICRQNKEHFAFLMGWLAQLFQEPGRKNGVAVVLRGDVGVGKTKLAEWTGNIIGDRHATISDKSEQCTGKFNAMLEMNIFVSAEEAFFAGDPSQKGPLNHLITGHKLMYEPKGRDAYMGRNYTRLMMTTNAKWAVPAVARERRYLVLDVSSKRQKQKAFFKAIDKQMEAGGAAAMLHELLTHDYSAIDFQNPPITDALKEIIQRGIDSSEKWLVSVLAEGRFPFRAEFGRSEVEWAEDGLEVAKSTVVTSYNDFVPSYRKIPADAQDVQLFLRERIGSFTPSKPTVGQGKLKTREPSWKLPRLSLAREAYSKVSGYVFEAEEPEEIEPEEFEPEETEG